MNMQGKRTHYFVAANSSAGYQNLIETNVTDLETVYVLTGEVTPCSYAVLAQTADRLTEQGIELECIHSAYAPDELDGLILRQQKIGVFADHLLPEGLEECFSKVISIDLTGALTGSIDAEKLTALGEQIHTASEKAYQTFAKAILVHDEWEAIYIGHMDFAKADRLTSKVIAMLLPETPVGEPTIARHRFFGGATYKGSLDYVPQITAPLSKRYFIKGRPGSGKSTMLKKIAQKAAALGYEVEVYHCGFDPKSLDMVLIQPLNLCIFDSTAPHEYFPDSARDEVIDMYAELIDAGTDEANQAALDDIRGRYQKIVQQGVAYLAEAKQHGDARNALLEQSIDNGAVLSIIDMLTLSLLSDCGL